MSTTTIDRLNGINSGVAIKAPCRVATTANITLSGEQTIDGVAVVANDRVLVKNQTSGVDNGIYVASTSGWSRDLDFDGSNDVVTGTLVYVTAGTANANTAWQISTTGTILPGTTTITFIQSSLSVYTLASGIATFLAAPSSANFAAALTSKTGTAGAVVLSVSPTIENPVFTSNATTPKITFNSTSGIIGTTTNDSAAAGSVGEFTSASGTNVSLTTGTAIDVASVSLTAGEWEVWGVASLNLAGTTTSTIFDAWVSTSSASKPPIPGYARFAGSILTGANPAIVSPTPPLRLQISGTTTVYLSVSATFAVSTATSTGTIYARRVR